MSYLDVAGKMSGIRDCFRDKVVLLTGATGFLGKALVEKILRELPDIGRLYLLIRPKELPDGGVLSAEERMRQEVFGSSVFDRVRRELDAAFEELVQQKVVAVAGDLSEEGLGLNEEWTERLAREVNVIINSAALVTFDAPVDEAINLNTLGVKWLMAFAHRCQRPVVLHVSTCYVSGKREGLIAEEVPPLPFDSDAEVASILECADELKRTAPDHQSALIEEGVRCARKWGWNDVYTFSKAMGEAMVVQERDELPTVILRPSIIESSLAEPEPGWLDGMRMIDPIVVAYARGLLKDFPGNPQTIIDLVPVDFVVNAILAAVPKAAQEGGLKVYQVASGTENPLTLRTLYELTRKHFRTHPLRDRHNKPIAVTDWSFPSLEAYQRSLERRLNWLRRISGLSKRLSALCTALERMQHYVQIYGPYATLNCCYETENTRRLLSSLTPEDRERFNFDVTRIDWCTYIQQIHLPGLKRHVLGVEAVSHQPSAVSRREEELPGWVKGLAVGEEPQTIPEVIAQSARKFPNKVALKMKRSRQWVRYSYADVARLMEVWGASLQQAGVGKGDRILLCAENQPEWGIAYLACSLIGATVVPVDRQTREEDLLAIADFTDAKALLTSQSYLSSLSRTDLPLPIININSWRVANHESRITNHESRITNHESRITNHESRITNHDLPKPDDVASIIFTTGVGVDPKGVMLTHRNLVSDMHAIKKVLPPRESDQFLSILPLHHAFEFTGGFLVPLSAGATITYVDTLRSRVVLETMREAGTTVLLGVPRVFQILHEGIEHEVMRRGKVGVWVFRCLKGISRLVRRVTGQNIGKILFAKVHQAFGGRVRCFISGGAALDPQIHEEFWALGFPICEGYGLTETAPVVTVNPMEKSKKGSVGPPLPGVEVKIINADERGIGEIVVRGPNVMKGYFHNDAATKKVLKDGWFHTGDLGCLDADGYLHLTGRLKEIIVTAAGKNVYPEEVEALYRGLPQVAEMCVVGVWDADALGETVHAVVVPEEAVLQNLQAFETFAQTIPQAIHRISQNLPTYQRIQQVHVWTQELPKTPALQVDRAKVKEMLHEQMSAVTPAARARTSSRMTGHELRVTGHGDWQEEVLKVVGQVAGVPRGRLSLGQHLETDLMMDSLMKVELLVALEAKFQTALPEKLAAQLQTVHDVLEVIGERLDGGGEVVEGFEVAAQDYWAKLLSQPPPDAEGWLRTTMGKRMMRWLCRKALSVLYHRWLSFECRGVENLPGDGPFIIAANHTSHLDSGAILMALGNRASNLFILGAKDYFFNAKLKGWFFHTFLCAVPFDRQANFIEGMRLAKEVLARGHPLLIFPEGTRSVTGELQPFKTGIGLLAYEANVPIVPAYIEGAFEALPKGRLLPRRQKIRVTFAPRISVENCAARKSAINRHELYQRLTEEVRRSIEEMAKR